jgi:hypothetical protein
MNYLSSVRSESKIAATFNLISVKCLIFSYLAILLLYFGYKMGFAIAILSRALNVAKNSSSSNDLNQIWSSDFPIDDITDYKSN